MLTPWKKSYDQLRQHIKKQRHSFANKCLSSQGYGFSSGHVWIWELDYEESWALKNWCFWTVVLEKTLESPLDCKEIQPVQPKGDQSWIFIGRTDFEAETPILWPADVKSWLIWKDPDAGKDWRLEEKGMTAGGQREELRPWQRSWGRRLGIRKGVIKPQETPCSWASTPKTRVYLLYCFMLSPTPLTLRGVLPHHHFSQRRS